VAARMDIRDVTVLTDIAVMKWGDALAVRKEWLAGERGRGRRAQGWEVGRTVIHVGRVYLADITKGVDAC